MLYVIQILAAIQIGLAVGVLLGPRHGLRMVSATVAIVLALATIVTGAWLYLVIGTAIFLATMGIRNPNVVGG